MKTILLIAAFSATACGGEAVARTARLSLPQGSRQLQLLEERRDLLKAATKIPSSLGLPEDLDGTEMRVYAWLTVYDAELQLARDQQKRVELCQDRVKSLLAWEKEVRALYDVGARGGDLWRVLRSQCRLLRGRISLARETSVGNASPPAAEEIASLRAEWRKTARQYAEAMRQAMGDGFNPQLILPALVELYDAELASATSAEERMAARRRHSIALRNVETWCQNARPKSDRWLTLLSARAQRAETELRRLQDEQAAGSLSCAASASNLRGLKRERLQAQTAYLAEVQERFWERTAWMEALLAACRGVCDAELELCRNNDERQAALAKWIDRLATLQSRSTERNLGGLSDVWDAECAAERLRLVAKLEGLTALPAT